MLTLPEHLGVFLSNIQPRPERLGLAQTFPEKIREHLQKTDLITTVTPHSRLAGSYARNTAIKNIKDVDILLFVDSSYRDDEDKGPKAVLKDLVAALKDLPETLGDKNGYIEAEPALRRQRRSIHVCFDLGDETFDIDIVPAVMQGDIEKPLEVPDKDWNKWIKTDPLGYGNYLSELNNEHGGKVVPLIKMLKHWRDAQMVYNRPKSYWLECMVVKHVEDGNLVFDDTSYAEIFASLLQEIYEVYLSEWNKEDKVPKVPDPMLGNNVAWNWERAEFETFMRRVDESRKWADRALNCDPEKKEDAIQLWQKIFNRDDEEYFPTDVDDTVKAILAGSKEGTLHYTSKGLILPKPVPGVQSWESPPHRFYGGEDE